jgi:hypothetical protein
VGYIDAGYAIVLGLLACYASLLFWRRRRLEHIARRLVQEPQPASRGEGR